MKKIIRNFLLIGTNYIMEIPRVGPWRSMEVAVSDQDCCETVHRRVPKVPDARFGR
jgi:hypothetical protein